MFKLGAAGVLAFACSSFELAVAKETRVAVRNGPSATKFQLDSARMEKARRMQRSLLASAVKKKRALRGGGGVTGGDTSSSDSSSSGTRSSSESSNNRDRSSENCRCYDNNCDDYSSSSDRTSCRRDRDDCDRLKRDNDGDDGQCKKYCRSDCDGNRRSSNNSGGSTSGAGGLIIIGLFFGIFGLFVCLAATGKGAVGPKKKSHKVGIDAMQQHRQKIEEAQNRNQQYPDAARWCASALGLRGSIHLSGGYKSQGQAFFSRETLHVDEMLNVTGNGHDDEDGEYHISTGVVSVNWVGGNEGNGCMLPGTASQTQSNNVTIEVLTLDEYPNGLQVAATYTADMGGRLPDSFQMALVTLPSSGTDQTATGMPGMPGMPTNGQNESDGWGGFGAMMGAVKNVAKAGMPGGRASRMGNKEVSEGPNANLERQFTQTPFVRRFSGTAVPSNMNNSFVNVTMCEDRKLSQLDFSLQPTMQGSDFLAELKRLIGGGAQNGGAQVVYQQPPPQATVVVQQQ